MASCKDCIHYRVCEYSNNDEYASIEILKDDCQNFIELIAVIMAMEAERKMLEELKTETDALIKNYAECMKDYAREIFEEFEALFPSDRNFTTISRLTLKRLKKKYTEGE